MWGIKLHHKAEISLSRQIFLSLKERILTGQMSQGEALPSTRELAKSLGVSRNTVCAAYDALLTEGFLVSRQGAPTRVAQGLHIEHRQAFRTESPPTQRKKTLVWWDFKTGQPDLSHFPWQLWRQMLRQAAENLPAGQLGYSGPKGYEPLCQEIACWLLRSRSMEVKAEDVFITAGATQALHLLTGLLYQEGQAFALESPSHPAIHTMVASQGYPLHWMPVDQQGADIGALTGKAISAVYVTPSHQFPLGGILPADRRAALIRLAVKNNFYIIEDDYDSEFRYSGSPVSPIYSMDCSQVVYVGTFSKTLFPALRLGFAVLPKALQAKWKHARTFTDVQNPVLEQAALAEFLHKRKIDKHVRRMRQLYGEKRKLLLRSVEGAFGDAVHPWGDVSGLHLALQFPGREFGEQFVRDSRQAGIKAAPLARYCPSQTNHKDKLLLGYGHLSPGQIVEGIKALRQLLEKTGLFSPT